MTEIPEHLLNRSRERRAALGLPGGEAAGTNTPAVVAGTTPAVAKAAAPAKAAAVPAAPPAPKPLRPYQVAARDRKRIPIWAAPILALLPLWGFLYLKASTPEVVEVVGPLAAGARVYNNCASCHGGDGGGGGAGYPLAAGSVLKTFPKIEEQLTFVYVGTKGYDGKPYGDPARGRIGGAKGQMPAWGNQLSEVEILEVVCHERYTLAGGDQASEEFLKWCTVDGEKFLEVEEEGFKKAAVPTSTE